MDVTMLQRSLPLAAATLVLAGGLPAPAAGQGGAGDARTSATDAPRQTRAAATAAGHPMRGPPAVASVPVDSVKATVRAFHEALAAGDSAAALGLLHPDLRVFEGGHAETLSEYRSGHLAADMAFANGVDRELLSERVFGGDGWAVYLSEYRVGGAFRGEEVDGHGTETMALVRTGEGWRIRHIHWSSR